MDSREDLDERRLARAVVAHQRHDFAGAHVEIDVGQRRDRAKALGDAAETENGLRTRGGRVGRFAHRVSSFWHRLADTLVGRTAWPWEEEAGRSPFTPRITA